ncbi:MAG: WYL domain-containing protein [Ilumatobacteraceae bacterium]
MAFDRAERLTNLLALLLSTPIPLSFDEIEHRLEGQYPTGSSAKRQAFERDKSMLRDLGVPIETEVMGGADAGRTGYRIDRERYELTDLDLAPDERRALQLAVAAVRSGTPLGTEALLKLGAGGPRDDAAVSANIPTLDALPVLREAVATRSPVSFTYRDARRVVDPWGVALRDGYWYVIGHDHDRGERRTFRVDRIDGNVHPRRDVRPPGRGHRRPVAGRSEAVRCRWSATRGGRGDRRCVARRRRSARRAR